MDKNLLGKTLIVAAGDHGESFGEKGESGHGVFLYEHVLHVPLIFTPKTTSRPGRSSRPRVRLIDIMPTVLDLMEAPDAGRRPGEKPVPYIQGRRRPTWTPTSRRSIRGKLRLGRP